MMFDQEVPWKAAWFGSKVVHSRGTSRLCVVVCQLNAISGHLINIRGLYQRIVEANIIPALKMIETK